MGRLEEREAQFDPEVDHSVTKHFQSAPIIQVLR